MLPTSEASYLLISSSIFYRAIALLPITTLPFRHFFHCPNVWVCAWLRQGRIQWSLWRRRLQLLHLLQPRWCEFVGLSLSHQLRCTHWLHGEVLWRSLAVWERTTKVLPSGGDQAVGRSFRGQSRGSQMPKGYITYSNTRWFRIAQGSK